MTTLLLNFHFLHLESSSPNSKFILEKTYWSRPIQKHNNINGPFCDSNGNIFYMPRNEFEVKLAKKRIERNLRMPRNTISIKLDYKISNSKINNKQYSQRKYASSINDHSCQNLHIFEDYDSYAHSKFKRFIRELLRYEDFIVQLGHCHNLNNFEIIKNCTQGKNINLAYAFQAFFYQINFKVSI